MKVMFSMYDDISDCAAPKTLCDWVKNFRMKKIQMRRKLRSGGDLRVCAIMATALMSAENQLRLKQQERLNRCLQLQSKFHERLSGSTTQTLSPPPNQMYTTSSSNNDYDENENENQKQRMEICNLWRDELNGLDEFMRKMSSSSSGSCSSNHYDNCNNYSNSNIGNGTCSASAFQHGDNHNDKMAAAVLRHSIAISS